MDFDFIIISTITLIGLAGFITSLFTLSKSIDSEGWYRINCEVISSVVEETMTDEGTYYKPIISYKYNIKGNWYLGDKVKYGESFGSHAIALRFTKKYSKGKIVKVSVDPNNPLNSVLEYGVSGSTYMKIFFFLLVYIIGAKLFFDKLN